MYMYVPMFWPRGASMRASLPGVVDVNVANTLEMIQIFGYMDKILCE